MNVWESVGIGVLVTLLAAEISDLGPWLARRLVKVSARLLLDPHLAEQHSEEWLAGIEDAPGKLTPLARAAGIMLIAVPVLDYRYFDDWWVCTIGLRSFTLNLRIQIGMPRFVAWGLNEDARSEGVWCNSLVEEICRALRSGPADQRGEALEALQVLLRNPPPWTIKKYARSMLRELPVYRRALTARGYLPEPG